MREKGLEQIEIVKLFLLYFLKSQYYIMKNIIISKNSNINAGVDPKIDINDVQLLNESTIHYFHSLIQKTLLAIQKYKQMDIIGVNEINLAIQHLDGLFAELSNNLLLLKSKNNMSTVSSNLDIIRNDISNIFKMYGTENIHDLLNIVFGDNYLKSVKWDNSKYHLIEKYFHPINFKVMPWNTEKANSTTKQSDTVDIEKNKIVEDCFIVEKSINLDCFDLSRTNKTFQTRVHGIKIAIHNEKERKTLIVAGVIDDILTSCIDNDFLNNKLETIVVSSINQTNYEPVTFQRYIQSLTLKELLVYSNDELLHRYQGCITQIGIIKQKPISQLAQEFVSSDLYGQRTILIQLLLKSDDHEYQYLAYLLYDLISSDNNGTIDNTEQTLLFDSLPWRSKCFFKDAMKQTINYTNNLSNFDNNKIPLEQQICLMKVSDSVKEKAMNKLKEVKSKTDDSGTKARTYLDGLLKIPFGIYKQEYILTVMNDVKTVFQSMIKTVNGIDNSMLQIDGNNVTNIQIKNICEKIKGDFIHTINDINIENLIMAHTNASRNDLITVICNINNIIKKCGLKVHKLNHSGKKLSAIKQQIKDFILQFKDDKSVIELLSTLNPNSNTEITAVQSIMDDITTIESKWNTINSYMNGIDQILDDAVHGHRTAKRQIKRIIAQWVNGELGGYCFGFEGPPGCGKTTLAKKGLAKCLVDENNIPRPFSFIAIGGQDNGSSLNGHNYTYVGSDWGKIVDILIKTKCMNPIIFIDELDKVSKTENGKEIIGILTHLIDSTQNDCFQDKYFNGIDIDLSKALFVFSYNDVSAIDKILLDRIHRIKFEHLSMEDKLVVTRKHLLPELYKNMGLENCIAITDDNIKYIIENYTNEPGIRKFKELLFEIIGEINLNCLINCQHYELPITVTNDDIKYKYLKDYHEHIIKTIPSKPSVGVINGLWANSMGQGGIIPIEAQFFHSTSFMELKLTGLQGDVMKESMNVAKTLVSTLVPTDIMKTNVQKFEETKLQGIHIHCPEGAVPKDGPSAGTAITCTLYSLLTGKLIKNTIAITGEINLQGCVTAIGGLELKILGGIKGGVLEFIFPKDNTKDYMDVVDKYKGTDILTGITFHPVDHISQVLDLIFEDTTH